MSTSVVKLLPGPRGNAQATMRGRPVSIVGQRPAVAYPSGRRHGAGACLHFEPAPPPLRRFRWSDRHGILCLPARLILLPTSALSPEGVFAVSDWADFHADLRQALEAFAAGDARPYKQCWTTIGDCTVFGAFGGVIRGPAEVRLRLDWAASQYHQGRYTVYEVLAEHACQDMGCIVALERVESSDDSGNTITRERRLTHVARREPEGWRIVHQHSDPLVTVTPQPT